MDELLGVLIGLGIILTVVTLVGHGIWVGLSYIFGSDRPFATSGRTRIDATWRATCEKCGAELDYDRRSCRACGAPQSLAQQSDGRLALRAVREQLETMSANGVLDAGSRARLEAVIDAETQRLAEMMVPVPRTSVALTPAKAPAPAPTAAAPAPEMAQPAVPTSIHEVTAAPPVAQHSPLAIGERARQYATRREAAAVEARAEEAAPVEPPKKRERLSRLFAAFMEEKNIRWGELIGGLLIIGCSIALVISFWAEIASRPLLKFVLFNGVTAALFGVGLYTDKRWKIHTTSHGVLLIATLLVPLNFLAIAAFTQASPPTDLLSLGGEVVSLTVFALLVFIAGRILVPRDATALSAGVMIPCLMQLVIRRFANPATSLATLYVLAAAPVASYLVTTAYAVSRRQFTTVSLDEDEAHGVLRYVGLVSVATLMPLALLLHNVPPANSTLHWLSPIVTLCGLPALSVGLLFWRRFADRAFAGLQTVGVGIGVLGVCIMLAAVVLAWPDPATVLPTALVLAAMTIAVAVGFGIPAAHLPAAVAIALSWLVSFHLIKGDVGWTVPDSASIKNALLSAASGHALVPLVAASGLLGGWLRRLRRTGDGNMIGLAAAATAVVSLTLVTWFGFGRTGDPAGAMWTLAIYTLVAIAAAIVLEKPEVAVVASALLFATLAQAIVYRFNPEWQLAQPWITALLAHATIVVIGCFVFDGLARRRQRTSALSAARRADVLRSFVFTGLVTSLVAALWIVATLQTTSAANAGVNLAWLAAVWALLAVLAASPAIFTAAQVALVFAILCRVTAAVAAHDWYTTAQHPWLDPWFIEVQGIALAAYCFLYGAVRRIIAHLTGEDDDRVVTAPPANAWTILRQLIDPPWPTVDRIVTVVLVLLLSCIAVYAAAPGAMQEWSPTKAVGDRVIIPIERLELAHIPHAHATGLGAWLLLGAVGVTLAASLYRNRNSYWRFLGLAVTTMAVCPLLAARWEPQVAVASALRWISAGFFAAASILVWSIPRLSAAVAAGAMRDKEVTRPVAWTSTVPGIARSLRDLLVAFVVLLYVVMAAFVGQNALSGATVDASIHAMWPWVFTWAVVAGVAGLGASYAYTSSPRNSNGGASGSTFQYLLYARNLLLLLAIAPIVILSTFAVAKGLSQHPLVGPDPASWFAKTGVAVSYGVPLVVIALTFVGYAVRDRVPGFAFSAGLLFNCVATLVVLLHLAHTGGKLDPAAWILVAQVNAIVTGVVALLWLAATKLVGTTPAFRSLAPHSSVDASQRPYLLITQVALAAAVCFVFLIPAVVNIVVATPPAKWAASADGILGWSAVALAAAAALWLNVRQAIGQNGVGLFAGALVALLAATVARTHYGNWQAYHTMLAGTCAVAWLLPLATAALNGSIVRRDELRPPLSWSAVPARLFGVVAVGLSIGGYLQDPARPWWTLAVLVAISARNVWIAFWEDRRGGIWIAALLLLPTTTIWWLDWASKLSYFRNFHDGFELVWINVLAAAILAVISVWLERRHWIAERQSNASSGLLYPAGGRRAVVPFHRIAAWAIVVVLMLTTAGGLLADLRQTSFVVSWPLAWGAWFAATIVAVACLWDPAVRWAAACGYCVGLVAVGMYLDGLNLHAPLFHWALANALAAYSLATSALWSVRDRLQRMAERLGAPISLQLEPISGKPNEQAADEARQDLTSRESLGHAWLIAANLLIGIGVLLLVWWIELNMQKFDERMVAAYAVGAQAFAIGLLAHGAVRTRLQYLALAWGVLFTVAFSWAWLPPDLSAPWLHRLVVIVAALTVAVIVYGFVLVKFLKRENEWTRAAERLVPSLAVLGAVLIFAVLGMEVSMFARDHQVPIAPAALVAVALALAGLAAAALVAALVPGRDPLGLSERGRTLYVYAAEALAALLFLHIRVTMDWLFRGWFLQFWPIIVMAIAFAGVGLAEVFQRRRQRVLSEPLENTGALLPLLPAIGFWIVSSQVHYSLLLLSIGVLYAALSVLRHSFMYSMMAAIAANGALWYFLSQHEGLNLTQHPQLWLIPPALCALAAGFINRQRLTPEQSTAIRYASAIVIYISSTADVFINGVAEAPWLPVVLAALSIVGVLAGILFRVRAFLYLGTAFLIVALMTIIWHAAIDQQHTWILWIAGIVTGVIIIAIFGLFEKRRDDVLRVVEELKHWHA